MVVFQLIFPHSLRELRTLATINISCRYGGIHYGFPFHFARPTDLDLGDIGAQTEVRTVNEFQTLEWRELKIGLRKLKQADPNWTKLNRTVLHRGVAC